jgi:hypothetical protein
VLGGLAAAAATAALAVAVLAGCGEPDTLSDEEGRTIAGARERLDDAIDTEETLRTSRVEARRLRREVDRLVSDGSFEDATLDEFGIARLGQLRQVVPSLVNVDTEGQVRSLDRRATAAFLRYATDDAPQAMLEPARRQVSVMLHILEEADAGQDTEIPAVKQRAETFVSELEQDVKPIWPSLGKRVAEAGADL